MFQRYNIYYIIYRYFFQVLTGQKKKLTVNDAYRQKCLGDTYQNRELLIKIFKRLGTLKQRHYA